MERVYGAGTENRRKPYSPVGRVPEGVAGSLCPLASGNFFRRSSRGNDGADWRGAAVKLV
jgi:hypothetical protein